LAAGNVVEIADLEIVHVGLLVGLFVWHRDSHLASREVLFRVRTIASAMPRNSRASLRQPGQGFLAWVFSARAGVTPRPSHALRVTRTAVAAAVVRDTATSVGRCSRYLMIGELPGLAPLISNVPGVGHVSVKTAWFDVELDSGG